MGWRKTLLSDENRAEAPSSVLYESHQGGEVSFL
jgi:hypothetical protein